MPVPRTKHLDLPDKPGVYLGTCEANSKPYVGSAAKSVYRRVYKHVWDLDHNVHPNIHLQRAWNKYGKEAFKFTLLELCEPEKCVEREQHWIDKLEAYTKGFNRCPTAGSRLGTHFSEESKAKMRAKQLGKKMSEETKRKMSATRKGKGWSDRHRAAMEKCHWSKGPNAKAIAAKIAAKNVGAKRSADMCARISEGRRKQLEEKKRATIDATPPERNGANEKTLFDADSGMI